MKRIISLLLVLVLCLSLVPMSAFADESTETTASTEAPAETQPPAPQTYTVKVKVMVGTKTLYTYDVKVGEKAVTLKADQYISIKDTYYKYSVFKVSGKKTHTVTIPAYDDTSIAARREFIVAEERRRELEQELARRKLAVKCKI